MTLQRLTEDFVRHYELLCDRTDNSPDKIRQALECDSSLCVSIRELDLIWHRIEQHRRTSRRRFIVQTHPKFPEHLNDYRARWLGASDTVIDWEHERDTGETFSAWLDRKLSEKAEATDQTEGTEEEESNFDPDGERWDFDPDTESAASLIEGERTISSRRVRRRPFLRARLAHFVGSRRLSA